jgi:hypothetical protein
LLLATGEGCRANKTNPRKLSPYESRIKMKLKANEPKGAVLVFAVLLGACAASGASLKPETIDAWNQYIKNVNLRVTEELQSDTRFLNLDAVPERREKVRKGQILAAPTTPNIPLGVPSGQIHDWRGAAFIANARLNDVLSVSRDYAHYHDFYKPSVLESAPLELSENEDRFSMVLANKSVFSKASLETEYRAQWFRKDDCRAYAIVQTTRVQEIADDGDRRRKLPENEGTGLIWRLYTITRLEERDGGVYVEMEAIALSRDIPAALRWFVEPVVRRVSRSSLTTSLHQTRDAVLQRLAASSQVSREIR